MIFWIKIFYEFGYDILFSYYMIMLKVVIIFIY